jgi:hypothetical protein
MYCWPSTFASSDKSLAFTFFCSSTRVCPASSQFCEERFNRQAFLWGKVFVSGFEDGSVPLLTVSEINGSGLSVPVLQDSCQGFFHVEKLTIPLLAGGVFYNFRLFAEEHFVCSVVVERNLVICQFHYPADAVVFIFLCGEPMVE